MRKGVAGGPVDLGEECGAGQRGPRGWGNEEVDLGAGSGAGALWGAEPIRLGVGGRSGR